MIMSDHHNGPYDTFLRDAANKVYKIELSEPNLS